MTRRPAPNPNYTKEPDLACEVAYAICRNMYQGDYRCVCESQGRGQTCDQMNRAGCGADHRQEV